MVVVAVFPTVSSDTSSVSSDDDNSRNVDESPEELSFSCSAVFKEVLFYFFTELDQFC